MKKLAMTSVLAGGIAAAFLGFAGPATAAPAGTGDAEQTINALEDQGYKVIVNRVGDTPLNEATVVGVRHGQSVTGLVPDRDGDLVNQVVYSTVYMDVQ